MTYLEHMIEHRRARPSVERLVSPRSRIAPSSGRDSSYPGAGGQTPSPTVFVAKIFVGALAVVVGAAFLVDVLRGVTVPLGATFGMVLIALGLIASALIEAGHRRAARRKAAEGASRAARSLRVNEEPARDAQQAASQIIVMTNVVIGHQPGRRSESAGSAILAKLGAPIAARFRRLARREWRTHVPPFEQVRGEGE